MTIMMAKKALMLSINPRLLIWARESLGKTPAEAARQLRINERKLLDWEAGKEKLRLAEVECLAKAYKRPLAAFFLPKPPNETPGPADFRTLPEDQRKPISSNTLLAVRRARRLRSLFKELNGKEMIPFTSSFLKIDLSQRPDPEILSARVRESLGVGIDAQRVWKDESTALAAWRMAVEKQGILIFQMPFPLEEGRGFSLADDNPPVIVVNSKDAVNGRIFSLLHELGHILQDKSGLCDMEYQENIQGENAKVEVFCNHLAGAIMVPKNDLLDMETVKSMGEASQLPEKSLGDIASVFHVSREVALRRLVILGKVSNEFYIRKRDEWAKKELRPRRGGKADPPKKCLQEKGAPFVSRVLDSRREGKITYNDVADFLGIRLKHMARIEKMVKGKSAT